jgi:Holliday junction resolvasome RuvABC endonuclease subunit
MTNSKNYSQKADLKSAPSVIRTLALDLGGSMGWAINMPDRIISGTALLAKNSAVPYGVRFMAMLGFLFDLLKKYAFTQIAFEMVNAGVHRGKAQIALNSGYRAMAQVFAAKEGMTEIPVHIGTAKKALTGNGHAEKSDMVRHATLIGAEPDSEDAADAVGVLKAALQPKKEIIHVVKKRKVKVGKERAPRGEGGKADRRSRAPR